MPAPSLATASRRLRGVLALFLLLAAWLSSGTGWASSRDQHWRTIESDHFYVHFYQGSEAAAERAVMLLERAHRRLAAGLAHEPWLKTHVTLTDNTDSANGVANTSPFPRITAYVTAPDSMSVLEGFDDWIDILLTHEYTHVVHLDTVHGLPRLVNGLLGWLRGLRCLIFSFRATTTVPCCCNHPLMWLVWDSLLSTIPMRMTRTGIACHTSL